MIKIIKNFITVFLFLTVIPLSVQAFSFDQFFNELEEMFSNEEWFTDEEWISEESNDSQIINKINVSTNTGNNTITGEEGEIIEGETKSQIYVKNIINGTEIDPIEIESDANEVKVKSEIKVEDEKAYVQREIEIDSEKTVENYEVDLESQESDMEESLPEEEIENEEETEETLDTIHNWYSDFIEDLKSFLGNIFNIF